MALLTAFRRIECLEITFGALIFFPLAQSDKMRNKIFIVSISKQYTLIKNNMINRILNETNLHNSKTDWSLAIKGRWK